MPFVVLGAVVAGILEEFLPQQAITRFLPKAAVPAVMVGALLGLLFPMCECGILVVMRRLLRKGLPLSCCVAYMLAGPIINGVVIFSTWVAFRDHGIGPEMVGLRVGLAFVVACVTGLVVQVQYRKYGNALLTAAAVPQPDPPAPTAVPLAVVGEETPPPGSTPEPPYPPGVRKPLMKRVSNVSATALHDFVDITVFLILGAVLAALVKVNVAPSDIQALSRNEPYLTIPAMMLMAVVMCLCSEADAFVAASFTDLHVSAKLAFLVLGPMLDIKLLLMYTRVFRPRLIVTIALTTTTLVLLLCLLVHAVYEMNGWSGLPAGARPA
ncbi:MAG: permease [Isosphaera sp.]|nr:permease [Isosphaera sp.]